MGYINVKRKSIKLPNGMKINFNKNSVSYTISNGKASYTYNPNKKMETKNVKISKDLSYIDKQKIKTKEETKIINPKLSDFFSEGLVKYIKLAYFSTLNTEGTVYEEGFLPVSDNSFKVPN